MIKRFLALSLVLFTLSGCELHSDLGDDQVVAGINFNTLFAPPTVSEINAVKIDWSSREYPAQNVAVEFEEAVQIGQKAGTLRIVSHRVGGVKHYGAIIAATGLRSQQAPMLVYSHGGDSGVSVDNEVQLVMSFFADIAHDFVIIIPSFRDEKLTYKSTTWQSEGPASPWDRDVDDVLSLLNVVQTLELGADPERVGVLGFSRGAGVGMLMAARSEKVDAVLDFFGPTDFFGSFVQDVSREYLLGDPRNLPGLDYLGTEILEPYRDGDITLEEIRLELIRRSPVFFADRINRLQIHHGTADAIVPVSQAESMISAMQAAGKTQEQFQSFIYPGGDHNPLTLDGSLERAKAFMVELLN